MSGRSQRTHTLPEVLPLAARPRGPQTVLQHLRTTAGFSQHRLGLLSGLHRSTVSGIECLRIRPGPDQLLRLGTVLGADPARLLDMVPSAPQERPLLTTDEMEVC